MPDRSSQAASSECRLLALPGEIRNKIYKYALTNLQGLVYVMEGGVGRLCAPEALDNTSSATTKDDEQNANTNQNDKRRKVDDNMYVEKYPGVSLQKYGSVSTTAEKDANQLKFTNQQLRKETKGLGLRYNDITFHGVPRNTAHEQALQFIQYCGKAQHKYLRTLHLRTQEEGSSSEENWMYEPEDHKGLRTFCANNSQVTVKVHMPCWIPRFSFINYMLICAIQFRGDRSILLRATEDEVVRFRIEKNIKSKVVGESFPANIRIMPHDDEFDEVEFRKACEFDIMAIHMLSSLKGGIDDWITLAKEAYEHGV